MYAMNCVMQKSNKCIYNIVKGHIITEKKVMYYSFFLRWLCLSIDQHVVFWILMSVCQDLCVVLSSVEHERWFLTVWSHRAVFWFLSLPVVIISVLLLLGDLVVLSAGDERIMMLPQRNVNYRGKSRTDFREWGTAVVQKTEALFHECL